MKQLKCEMCGSAELIKQDGVFVCQSCGCKYSVEEAKKLMETDEESKHQLTTNTSGLNIDNLLELAFNEKNVKNYSKEEGLEIPAPLWL